MTLNPCVLNVIMYSRKYLLLLSQLRTRSSKITNTIDFCTILDKSAQRALKGYRLIQVRTQYYSQKAPLLGIPLYRLSATTTTIYDFNARSSHPLGKIRLRCRIGDLKSEMTCYVIDTDTSYNLLLGWPWIHANWIVPSTLHQCF